MTGEGNWTWLVRGRVATLIDAGVGVPAHLDELEKALAGDRLAQVLVTHTHPDHAAGAAAIAGRMPHVRFFKMPAGPADERWGVTWEPLTDTERLEVGDSTLDVVHTPGHAPDHVCFWHADTRTLFGGDLAQLGTTVWIPASEGGDVAEYLASLERVIALSPVRLLPAHGPIVDNPTSLLRNYIAHRLQREAQIVDGLHNGDRTAAQIVARVYPTLPATLVDQARETVTAHLYKLERERRVRRAANAWHIIEP
jgi:glyoxylase-like metal-dependent hydrolase (beta-lactamase superfamily II)